MVERYAQIGGMPELDGDFTVVGQIFEGLDVAESMNAVETETVEHISIFNRPLNPIVIERMWIESYKATETP